MAHPMLPLLPSLALMALSSLTFAADNTATTAAALKILTRSHDAAPETPQRMTVTVDRSETLDMFVRRHYTGWPLKEELLRKALAELNPKVLPNAANSLLKRGSTLNLPNAEDLRRTLLRQYPAAAELVKGAAESKDAADAQSHTTQSSLPPQRRWVRYP